MASEEEVDVDRNKEWRVAFGQDGHTTCSTLIEMAFCDSGDQTSLQKCIRLSGKYTQSP